MTKMPALAAALLVAINLATVQAQPVYRCGNAYSQVPCAHGRAVEAADVRAPAQQVEAREVAANERQLAATMRRDRLADERAIEAQGAVSLSGAAAPSTNGRHPSVAAARQKHTEKNFQLSGRDFVAIDPAGRKRRNRD